MGEVVKEAGVVKVAWVVKEVGVVKEAGVVEVEVVKEVGDMEMEEVLTEHRNCLNTSSRVNCRRQLQQEGSR